MFRSIAHPTDFSPEGQVAFAHALRLALHSRCRLNLLHVHGRYDTAHFDKFPHVREALTRWGRLTPGADVEDIKRQTGVEVRKVEIRDENAGDGLSKFFIGHGTDLIVMATHGRAGLDGWLRGSVSSGLAGETHTPVLLIGPDAKPFVDPGTGDLVLETILAPLARNPSPLKALRGIEAFSKSLNARVDFLHVGSNIPRLVDEASTSHPIRTVEGPVVETIISEAESTRASLIAMPTEGQKGVLDALRGSTTERVVALAPCPVLALPV